MVDTTPRPTKLSEFQNDVPYLSTVSWYDINDRPTIPSYTSQLTNDSGYVTSAQVNQQVKLAKTKWKTWTWGSSDPYLHQPFTVRATQANSSVYIYRYGYPPSNSFEYSTDNGQTWNAYSEYQTISMPNIDDTVMFRNASTSTQLATNYTDCHRIAGTGEWAVEGNIDSLLNKDFDTTTTTYGTYALGALFESDPNYCVRDASNLIFPDHPLTTECYRGTFWNTHLVKGPQLRATTLAEACYSGMFNTNGYLTEVKLFYTGNLYGNSAFTGSDPWMAGTVSSTGTLYYNGSDTTRGNDAIPYGWNVVQF